MGGLLLLLVISVACADIDYSHYRILSCPSTVPPPHPCHRWARPSPNATHLACPVSLALPPHCFVHNAHPALTAREERVRLTARRRYVAAQTPLEDFFAEFRDAEEYAAFVTDLSTQFAQWVRVESLGRSHEGRDIAVVRISTGGENKPAISYGALIHSREWLAGMSGMWTTYTLLAKLKAGDKHVVDLLRVADVYAIPILNPDGFAYTWSSSSNRYWRKTRSPNKGSTCVGTDPNRNFPSRWDSNEGSSGNPCSETFRGSAPMSEVEAQALSRHFATLGSRVAVWYDVHAYGAMFMSPWGKQVALPPDYSPTMVNYLSAAQSAMRAATGMNFRVGSIADTIYVATGSTVDYAYDTFDCVASVTIEVRGNDFVVPPSQIAPSGTETYEALLAVARLTLL